MRKLTTRVIVLLVVAQWLSTVGILVLIAGMGTLIAGIVCVDLLLASRTG